MPRSLSNNTLLPLLQRLAQKVGKEQAHSELRWLTEYVREELTATGHPLRTAHNPTMHHGARIWRDQPAPSTEEIERDHKRFTPVQWAWLRQAIKDRTEHNKPLQYIIGDQLFGKANIVVRPPVLIPRWETEEWMIRLAELICAHNASLKDSAQRRPLNVLDACTGSGCVSLGLASELPPDTINALGVDISTEAVSLALENLALNQALLNGNSVRFRQLDLMGPDAAAELVSEADGLKERSGGHGWDMIVSNPPYVTPAEYDGLDPDVREWEDRRALVPPALQEPSLPNAEERHSGLAKDDPDGVSFVVQLAKLAREIDLVALSGKTHQHHTIDASADSRLPRLVVEIGGKHQVEAVCQIMRDHGLNSTEVWKDMAGHDRVVLGYSKPK
ncbi:hypothetical protein IW140_003369 [Coemansia sp. RSA 1813]|nr:hypothetical protein EV178_003188 [Coemansia sp. RSA 1646]KAJ1770995.1 hypothetical protein LPJ74_002686 [Coemansia sp. RSA 1843]KAJ2089234.1 hypothetical protein IW138_003554 [Coemansia sp. RSA 986]KAJ2215064.1 hypothetical protein EV179_002432 [Coemansia sp. RSA 487]KAJ2569004.1 hypothetical protein IW140_003369 [Coemansia sp. RSA 1813]